MNSDDMDLAGDLARLESRLRGAARCDPAAGDDGAVWNSVKQRAETADLRIKRTFLAIAAGTVLVAVCLVVLAGRAGRTEQLRVAAPPQTSAANPSTKPTTKPTGPSARPDGVVDFTWISPQQGWALEYDNSCPDGPCAKIVTTIDGGATWSRINAPNACLYVSFACPAGKPAVSSIRFADSNIGYAFGPDLFVTSDGARTWIHQTGPAVVALEIAGSRVTRLSYTQSGCPGPCDLTVDAARVGSTTWQQLTTFGHSVGAQLVIEGQDEYAGFYGNLAAGAGTQEADFLISEDSGATWTARGDPCGPTGPDPHVATTIAAEPAGSVAALCRPRGGQPGATFIVVSTDRGQHFGPPRPVPAGIGLGSVVALAGPSTIFVAGPVSLGSGSNDISEELYASQDRGQHWTLAATDTVPISGSLPDNILGFQSSDVGHWVGSPNKIWTTIDGGQNWAAHQLN